MLSITKLIWRPAKATISNTKSVLATTNWHLTHWMTGRFSPRKWNRANALHRPQAHKYKPIAPSTYNTSVKNCSQMYQFLNPLLKTHLSHSFSLKKKPILALFPSRYHKPSHILEMPKKMALLPTHRGEQKKLDSQIFPAPNHQIYY